MPSFVTAGAQFLWNNRKYWWVLLFLVIAVQAKVNHNLNSKIDELQGGSLKLGENEVAKVNVGEGNVASAVRDGKGGVKRGSGFKAPEAKVGVTVKKDPAVQAEIDELNRKLAEARAKGEASEEDLARMEEEKKALEAKLFQVDVDVQRWGFVFKPGFGIIFDGDVHPEADVKFLFFDRYSLKVGSSVTSNPFFTAGLTRHIDDFVPRPLDFKNLEVQILFGTLFKEFLSDKRLVIGARINL